MKASLSCGISASLLLLTCLLALAGCSAYRRAPLTPSMAGEESPAPRPQVRAGDRVRLDLVGGGLLKGRVRAVHADGLVVRGRRLEVKLRRVDDEEPQPPVADHLVRLADIRTLDVYDGQKALAGLLGAVAGVGIAMTCFVLLVFSSGPGLS